MRLSEMQRKVVETYIRHGCLKGAAHELGVTINCVSVHMNRARHIIGQPTVLLALLAYERERFSIGSINDVQVRLLEAAIQPEAIWQDEQAGSAVELESQGT